ncbi:MAG: hypothetical protein JWO71_3718 [Candidatus Acidoferrum typicum]|nr:hypothetical protein [Candidatus Acidoferrum typicum]
MATAVLEQTQAHRTAPNRRRYEHLFFSAMALLILATVFLGFARTYFLAGIFRAPLPNWLIHVHGAAFSSWIILLVTQTSLVSAGRTDIHRRLGVLGFALASLMVVLGMVAGTDALRRGFAPPGIDAKTFYIIPITDMLFFGTLVFFAFRARFNPPAHKRLILIGTSALMIAAVSRWPFAAVNNKVLIATLISDSVVLLIAAYDLFSTRKIHRATLYAGIFLIVAQQIRFPIAQTAAWHAVATWALNIANSLHGA